MLLAALLLALSPTLFAHDTTYCVQGYCRYSHDSGITRLLYSIKPLAIGKAATAIEGLREIQHDYNDWAKRESELFPDLFIDRSPGVAPAPENLGLGRETKPLLTVNDDGRLTKRTLAVPAFKARARLYELARRVDVAERKYNRDRAPILEAEQSFGVDGTLRDSYSGDPRRRQQMLAIFRGLAAARELNAEIERLPTKEFPPSLISVTVDPDVVVPADYVELSEISDDSLELIGDLHLALERRVRAAEAVVAFYERMDSP